MEKRRLIGLLVPSSNVTMEQDIYRHLPDNISLHVARMYIEETTVAGESRMPDEFALPAARDLGTVRPHVVVFGCTSAGALRGSEYDRELCAGISEITEAKKVLILTPYVDELNQLIRRSVEEAGLEVLDIFGLGISENLIIAEVEADEIVQFAKEKIQGLNPDSLFISCTNFRAMEAILG